MTCWFITLPSFKDMGFNKQGAPGESVHIDKFRSKFFKSFKLYKIDDSGQKKQILLDSKDAKDPLMNAEYGRLTATIDGIIDNKKDRMISRAEYEEFKNRNLSRISESCPSLASWYGKQSSGSKEELLILTRNIAANVVVHKP